MTADQSHPDVVEAMGQERLVHLRRDGVSLVLDAREGLPSVAHWGSDLGDLDVDVLGSLAAAVRPRTGQGAPSEPAPAIVPEASAPWYGLPGLVGHRDTVDWAPRFDVVSMERADATGGPTVHVEAADSDLALGLRIEVLLAGGNFGGDLFHIGFKSRDLFIKRLHLRCLLLQCPCASA